MCNIADIIVAIGCFHPPLGNYMGTPYLVLLFKMCSTGFFVLVLSASPVFCVPPNMFPKPDFFVLGIQAL